MAAEESRQPTPQTRSLRSCEVRRTNYVGKPETVHDDYESANTEAENDAEWGTALSVLGYDDLVLFVDHTAGTATTAVHVAAQLAFEETQQAASWYDLWVDEAGDGVLVRKVWDWTTSASGRVSFQAPVEGAFMRFKVWTDGGNRADSRALLRALRQMRSE